MSEERPVKKHMWQTQTAFTVTLKQDDFLNFFKWPATIASMFQWHVLYFSILKIQIDGWAVGGDNSLGNFKASIYQSRYLSIEFFLTTVAKCSLGGAI